MSTRRYEQNGQVWEVGEIAYVRYAGEPCVQCDMRGDPRTYFGHTTVIVEVCDLGDGWTRYWTQDRDPKLQDTTRGIVEAQERAALRG